MKPAVLLLGPSLEAMSGVTTHVNSLLGSALGSAYSPRAELARMSQACRQRILSAYSLERLADDFTAIYSILIPWPASQAG